MHFAQEIVGAAVHGLFAILAYFCFCYNHVRKNKVLAGMYLGWFAFELRAIYKHVEDAFKEGSHDSRKP